MVRNRRNLIYLVPVVLFFFGLLFGGVKAQSPDQPLTITLRQKAYDGDPITGNPVSIAGKDITTVEIELAGGVCPAVPRTTPVDVVLLIDISGSMAGEKLVAAQEAAVNFLSYFNLNSSDSLADQVAVVAFESLAYRIVGLSRDQNALTEGIQSLATAGGTNMADGLSKSTDILAGPEVNSAGGAVPVIVLLSDGAPDSESDALAQAERARTVTGAQIVTIGLGSDINRDFLIQIADTEADAHFAATPAELGAVYQRVATEIQPRIAALDIEIRFTYNRALYELQPNSIKPTDGRLEGDTIIWNYDRINAGRTQTFQFDVRSTTAGPFNVGDVQVAYTACEEEGLRDVTVANGPTIDTLIPTPTPLPTSTPTPTLTPTPTITPTASPIPPQVEHPERVMPTTAGVTADYCAPGGNSRIWDIALWAIVLLVSFFLLLWGWRRGQGGFWQRLCALLPALLGIWFIALLAVLIQPFKVKVCDIPESVYFWRERDLTTGIYLTHEEFQGDIPPQVESLNANECIGCHDVSNASQRVASIIGPLPGTVIITNFDNELIRLRNVRATYIAFSPDGNQLAITDENSDIQIFDIATGTLTPLQGASNPAVSELMPAWSTDGQIAFVVGEPINVNSVVAHHQSSIWMVSLTGDPAQEIISQANLPGVNYHPSFSKDGRWLAFVNAPTGSSYANPLADIYLYDRVNNTFKKIEDNALNANDSYPAWNNDSTKLAFNTSRDADANIMVVSVDSNGVTTHLHALNGASETGVFEYRPVWGDPIYADNPLSLDNILPGFPILLVILLFLMLLCYLFNRSKPPEVPEEEFKPVPVKISEPIFIEGFRQVDILWKAQPTLVVGLGHAGRHILTHVKKNLLDAGLGETPSDVRLLCIVSGSQAMSQQKDYTFAGITLNDDELIAWRDSLKGIFGGAENNEDAALREWLKTRQITLLDPQTGLEEQRVLGRVALINNLRGGVNLTKVNLWNRLKELGKATQSRDERLNVVLVSALDDAVGSGAFMDVAFLVRQMRDVLRSEGIHIEGVRITAHLITDKVDSQQSGIAHRQANVTAALRELKRFQLAGIRPTKIGYRPNDQVPNPITGEKQDQPLTSPLFDDIFVHDGNSRRALYAEPAPVGVFAAIADSITLWMDTATQDADLAAWRSDITRQTHDLQVTDQSIIISGLGIYQYRLPFADLLENMTLEFAGQVLRRLLMGANPSTPELRVDLIQDEFAAFTPDRLIQEFFSGRIGSDTPLDVRWSSAFAAIYRNDGELKNRLNALKKPSEADQATIWRWFDSALRTILNGRSGEQAINPVVQRGAKIGYALAFLEALAPKKGQGILQQIKGRVLEVAGDDEHPMLDVLNSLERHTQKIADQIRTIADTLGATQRPNSMYQHFGEEVGRFDSIWEDLQKIKTRRYILSDDSDKPLHKVWYAKYMVQHVDEALNQLYWRVEDEQLSLCLKLGKNDIRILDVADARSFEQALLALGRHYAQAVRHHETLATVLHDKELSEANLQKTTQQLLDNSNANLGVRESNDTTFMRRSYILSVNENVRLDELQEALANKRIAAKILNTNDPYTLSLIETIDTVPYTSVPSLQTALKQYNSDLAAMGGESFVTAVFEPEATALDYERGIEARRKEFTRPRRLIHPVIVGSLTNRVKAEVYLLAASLTSQLVSEKADVTRANWVQTKQMLRFQSPEWTGDLLDLTRNQGKLGLVMNGLYAFVERIDDASAAAIYQRYRNDDTLHEFWEHWLTADGEPWQTDVLIPDPVIQQDLIDITRLLILQLFGE